MEDAGFIIGSYVVTFGADRRLRLVGAAPGPPGRRRGCPTRPSPGPEARVCHREHDRPQPAQRRRRTRRPAASPLGADRRARPRARRRRRDRHPVPPLGRRLLLQRRRDRPARRLRAGPAPARPGHRRRGARSTTADGVTTFTISFDGATLPVRYEGQPGGIFEECEPVVVHGELVDGTFEGDRVEVKHSNEYEAENADRLDERRGGVRRRARRQPERGARPGRADAARWPRRRSGRWPRSTASAAATAASCAWRRATRGSASAAPCSPS